MKKRLKIILPILAVILVIAGGIAMVITEPLRAMRPLETGLVFENYFIPIFALRSGRGNLFLIDTGEGYLMIDAGNDVDSVQAGLWDLRIEWHHIKWILLTHTHGDHVGALPMFRSAEVDGFDVEVYMSRDEFPELSANDAPGPTRGLAKNVRLLSDGEKLVFGNVEVECIAAPGHTAGSMVYLADGRYLFTGDALRYSNEKVSVHPFTQNKAQAVESIAALPNAMSALTSHYGLFSPPWSSVSFLAPPNP
ncbi:MAG: MBL fold metallo-hydrolase [Oscillospiraceae bacterium]|nr:MBL fold metallo-hydrolase [Oscillospiraceae bacterium]